MQRRIAEHDWAATPLGPMDGWPQSLRTAVRIVLGSRFAMWMAWGPELTFFYNDAYREDTLAEKHPWALGRTTRAVWAEIWGDIGPRIEQVMATGEATWDQGLQLFLERRGFREETYHTFSYSPLSDDGGTTAGMLCVVVEETERVIGERRIATLRDLAAEATAATTERELFGAVERSLARNARDLPFAFAYTTPEQEGEPPVPATAGAPAWRDAVPAAGAAVLVELSDRRDLPSGAWPEPPRQALAIALADTTRARSAGMLVAGLNPYRPLDEGYRGFLELLGGQIAASLASVRAREAERRRAEALAELDRVKTDFFSNVSHEFRTPLSLILGPAEDALAEAADGEQAERLSVVFRNALRLQKLVNNLLEFSRIEAGHDEPEREPTELGGFTADLASMFRAATDRAGIALVVERPEAPVTAQVDREMWERIVLNLVSNAFKFTFEGEIRVALRRDGADAVLTVSDTGTGIEPEELTGLFERFRRVRGARSRTHEGSGIGLALVQELVRMHGGSVTADSELGAGSTFTVRVPLDEAATAAAATPTSGAAAYLEEALRWLPDAGASVGELAAVGAGLAGDEDARDRRARILIADDNADLRGYLERLLARDWEVETVPDGRAALDAIAARRPDLVLSDAMMPEVDGFGLLAFLRADPATSQLPVIMLSARAGEEAAVEGLAAGADDYLLKPFSSRELIARVRANLDLAELRQAAARAMARHAQLLRDLADAAVAVNRAATVPEVLAVVAERARGLVGAERSAVRLEGRDADDPPGGPFSRRVPLTSVGARPLGWLLLGGETSTGGVEAEAVLTQLAQVAATRLANALLYEREHRVAETLQRSLLPESLPTVAGAELAALYLPGSSEASVGGDWYDAIAIDERTVTLVIGDVVGRGVKAASAMGQLRNAVRAYLLEGYGPAQTLSRVNRLLDTLGGGFATLACLCLDTRTGVLRYANAGHPPPLIVGPDGATRWLEDGLAPPIGAAREIAYRQAEDAIPDGGALVLYTDGLVERRDEPIDSGLARLAEAASDSPGHAATLAGRLVGAVPGTARPDDVAVLALARLEAAGEPLVVRLPAEATSLSPLRDRLRRWLEATGADPRQAADVLLAVGEAASNAIEHALEPDPAAIVVTARGTDGGGPTIEIRDHGRWDDQPSAPHRGRGMQIMRAIAGDVAVDRSPTGTIVTIQHRKEEGAA